LQPIRAGSPKLLSLTGECFLSRLDDRLRYSLFPFHGCKARQKARPGESMKWLLAILIALAAALSLAAQNPDSEGQSDAGQQEGIRSFDSRITVNDDGTMRVRETIAVQVTGDAIHHGITRDFPTLYTVRGFHSSVGFEIESVQRDGTDEPYQTEDLTNGVRVRVGRADYELPPGRYTYGLTYRTSRQLGFLADHDELYWNVTGTGWAFPIELATATVVLPERVRNVITGLDGFTGYAGSQDKNFTAGRDRDSNPVFRAEHLLSNQGLSVVVTWPKGLIREPTREEKRKQFIADNNSIVAGAAGLALVLAYFLAVWAMIGRDPKAGTIVPFYEPQDDLSPAAMRYLEHMAFDEKVFTAAILGLAAKGYLTIGHDKYKYRLHRKPGYGPVESKLSADEKTLARKLFENGDKLDLSEHSLQVRGADKALEASLKTAMEKTYFVTNQRYMGPGVILTAAATVVMTVLGGGAFVAVFMSIWLTGWSVCVSVLMISVFRAWRSVHAGAGAVFGAVFITLFSLPFLGGEALGIALLWRYVGAVPVLIMFLGIGINLLFHFLLKAPTRAGRSLMDRIEGFRMFLTAVDGDRLQRMALPEPEKTPELFERYLPYALALGVEHAWAGQFTQVLAASAAQASSSGGSSYSPSWYSGGGSSSFSPSDFTSTFSSSFSSAVSSASAPASSSSGSSGSGGGGFSGGGGGGGGGGGW
jgi:hypothetical protein